MSIKFSFSDRQGKQNGRIHWRFDENHSKMLFFTSINQIGLELVVSGETSLLMRPGKKLYWRGDFNFLLDRLWGIDMTLRELKQLLIKGLVPEAKIREKRMAVCLETNPKDQSPQIVNIKLNDSTLILKIMKREVRTGSIILLDYERRFQPGELEEVLGDD